MIHGFFWQKDRTPDPISFSEMTATRQATTLRRDALEDPRDRTYRKTYARSVWTPPTDQVPPKYLVFLANVGDSFKHPPLRHPPNLSTAEQNTMGALLRRCQQEIVIAPADKGNTTVVLSHAQYFRMAYAQLRDTDTYARVHEEPQPQAQLEGLARYILPALPSATKRRLLRPGTSTPYWYGLPKLHKKPVALRPIVAQCDTATYWWSLFLHETMWPAVQRHPGFLLNTTELCNLLRDPRHHHSSTVMATLDVVALYPSIRHEDGLRYWHAFANVHHPSWAPALTTIMQVILTSNVFLFNGELFHQLRGTAMGSPAAVVYANIFMFGLERDHLATIIRSSQFYRRYIDDCIVTFDSRKNRQTPLSTFVTTLFKQLNDTAPVRFTWTISDSRLDMLDLEIRNRPTGFEWSTHFKPTNRFLYLHPESNHPSHTWRAIVKGELIRMTRTSSTTTLRAACQNFLANKLLLRGFSQTVLARVQFELLTSLKRPSTARSRAPPLVLHYHPGLRQARGLLHHAWIQAGLVGPPPMVAWKRDRNLGSLLGFRHTENLSFSSSCS